MDESASLLAADVARADSAEACSSGATLDDASDSHGAAASAEGQRCAQERPPHGQGTSSKHRLASSGYGQERILQKGAVSHLGRAAALVSIEEPDSGTEPEESRAEHRSRLAAWCDAQLSAVVALRLRDAAHLPAQWQHSLEALATRAAASLRPDANSSINSILKVKTLAGGSRADSHYVDGLVCRMKLAHKCMKTELSSPRILLLDCALEHERSSFSTSLEALRQQEEELLHRPRLARPRAGAKQYRLRGEQPIGTLWGGRD